MYFPSGIITSMVTNFKENGEVDYSGIVKNLEFQRKSGIKEVCVLGGTGEATSLSKSQRHKIMEKVMENSDELEIIFGALVGNLSDVTEDIKKAKELGASACLVMPPPFIMPSNKDVIRYFENLEQLGMPLIIFNSPGRLGYDLPTSTILEIGTMNNVVGVKESSGDIVKLQSIIQNNSSKTFSILTGGDTMYLPSIAVGANGGLVALPSVIPELFLKMNNSLDKSDYESAQKYHYNIKKLDDLIYKESHPIPLKVAMECRGLLKANCRLPFKTIDENLKDKVVSTVNQLDIVNN